MTAEECFRIGEEMEEDGGFLQWIIASYKKAIELDPQYAEAYFRLGVIYHDSGAYVKARKMLKEAKMLSPEIVPEGLMDEVEVALIEVESMKKRDFNAKSAIAEFGISPKTLDPGKNDVIDAFRLGKYKIAAVNVRKQNNPNITHYYRLYFYPEGSAAPAYVMNLESITIPIGDDEAFIMAPNEPNVETCCMAIQRVSDGARMNMGLSHEYISYEEFKYKALQMLEDLGCIEGIEKFFNMPKEEAEF